MQWLMQNYQRRTLRRAVRQAYITFAHTYPNWVATLFDEHFVSAHLLPVLQSAAERGEKVTSTQVAGMWARQVSMLPSLRQKHTARMMPAATHFLCMVADALVETQVNKNTPVLVETAAG
jgi:hypothetical protein